MIFQAGYPDMYALHVGVRGGYCSAGNTRAFGAADTGAGAATCAIRIRDLADYTAAG